MLVSPASPPPSVAPAVLPATPSSHPHAQTSHGVVSAAVATPINALSVTALLSSTPLVNNQSPLGVSPFALRQPSNADAAKNGLGAPHSPVKRFMPENWEEDEYTLQCNNCNQKFSFITRKHHCRNCGSIFCDDCTKNRISIPEKNYLENVRVCDRCYFSLSILRNADRPSFESVAPSTPRSVSRSTTAIASSLLSKDRPESQAVAQLKSQVHAMEDVSKALMIENRQLRKVIESLESIHHEQRETIAELKKVEQAQREELLFLKQSMSPTQISASPSSSPSTNAVEQTAALQSELRELHVRMSLEQDDLYSELMYTKAALQMAQADIAQLTRENQRLSGEIDAGNADENDDPATSSLVASYDLSSYLPGPVMPLPPNAAPPPAPPASEAEQIS